jgi:hypothetical protein
MPALPGNLPYPYAFILIFHYIAHCDMDDSIDDMSCRTKRGGAKFHL